VVASVADALQYISYYHPPDFIKAMHAAYREETSSAAQEAIRQILVNSRMSATGHRPLCQDTGIVIVFAEIGAKVQFSGNLGFEAMINEGVRQAYNNYENPLRKSIVNPPFGARTNTGDNTPAVIHTKIVPGDKLTLTLAAKGGGSENKATYKNLNPAADVEKWVVDTVASLGSGWCPPGIIGVGIGGSPEKAMLLAKESLMQHINIHEIIKNGPQNPNEELRLSLYNKLNSLGIGAQGLGGKTTVLDVKLKTYPTHAVSLPVALVPNCAASRHIKISLNGPGPAHLPAPDLSDWPEIDPNASSGKKIDLARLNKDTLKELKIGETVLLSGKILTARDAAHKRIQDIIKSGRALDEYGLDFKDRLVYYVGPVNPVKNEIVGPAGPTTATRMDRYTEMMLGKLGLLGMIGKAERGSETVGLIKKYNSVYFIAVGGAAYLVSKAIKSSKVLAFEDLGMEAVYEFEVKDMPVQVAVDSQGNSIHEIGPEKFRVETS